MGCPGDLVRDGLSIANETDIGGWDGYYAAIARAEGVDTLLTIDDDFESVSGFTTDVVLSPEEFARLNDFLGYWPRSSTSPPTSGGNEGRAFHLASPQS